MKYRLLIFMLFLFGCGENDLKKFTNNYGSLSEIGWQNEANSDFQNLTSIEIKNARGDKLNIYDQKNRILSSLELLEKKEAYPNLLSYVVNIHKGFNGLAPKLTDFFNPVISFGLEDDLDWFKILNLNNIEKSHDLKIQTQFHFQIEIENQLGAKKIGHIVLKTFFKEKGGKKVFLDREFVLKDGNEPLFIDISDKSKFFYPYFFQLPYEFTLDTLGVSKYLNGQWEIGFEIVNYQIIFESGTVSTFQDKLKEMSENGVLLLFVNENNLSKQFVHAGRPFSHFKTTLIKKENDLNSNKRVLLAVANDDIISSDYILNKGDQIVAGYMNQLEWEKSRLVKKNSKWNGESFSNTANLGNYKPYEEIQLNIQLTSEKAKEAPVLTHSFESLVEVCRMVREPRDRNKELECKDVRGWCGIAYQNAPIIEKVPMTWPQKGFDQNFPFRLALNDEILSWEILINSGVVKWKLSDKNNLNLSISIPNLTPDTDSVSLSLVTTKSREEKNFKYGYLYDTDCAHRHKGQNFRLIGFDSSPKYYHGKENLIYTVKGIEYRFNNEN